MNETKQIVVELTKNEINLLIELLKQWNQEKIKNKLYDAILNSGETLPLDIL